MALIDGTLQDRDRVSFIEDAVDQGVNRRVEIRAIASGVSMPVTLTAGARTTVALVYYDHVVPVTTAAYTQLIASTTDVINNLQIFDSSGQMLVLAVGPAASEVDKLYIFPGGNGSVDLTIPAASRVSVKAVTANTTGGYLAITGIK